MTIQITVRVNGFGWVEWFLDGPVQGKKMQKIRGHIYTIINYTPENTFTI